MDAIAPQVTAKLMAAMHTSADSWRDFADATHVVSGERREITKLIKDGVDRLPGGTDRAQALSSHVHEMHLTHDAAIKARDALVQVVTEFPQATEYASTGSSQLITNRLAHAATTMTPELSAVRRLQRPDIDGKALGWFTVFGGGVGSGVSIPMADIHAAALATLPDLLVGVGGPITAFGGAALVASHLMMRAADNAHVSVEDIIRGLDTSVSSAVDAGNPQRRIPGGLYQNGPSLWVLGSLSTRRAMGRLPEIDHQAHAIATATANQTAEMGDLVRHIQDAAQSRATHSASLIEQDRAVAARLTQRQKAYQEDWTKVLESGDGGAAASDA